MYDCNVVVKIIVTSTKAILSERKKQELVHHILHTETSLGSKNTTLTKLSKNCLL